MIPGRMIRGSIRIETERLGTSMKLKMWDIELKHGDYIRKIIRFRLPYADDADLERVYQAVLKSLRRKAEKDYELKAKFGIRSLKTFLKRITLRRVVDYLRKRSVLEQIGEAPIQASLDVNKIGVLDENIERFLKRGPRKYVTHVGGIEIRPLLNQVGNKLMWITLAEQLVQSEKIERDRRLGWNEHGGKRVLTRKEIIERIASDWGISTEAIRLRLYRSRRKFRMLWERAKRLQEIKQISYNRTYQTHL